MSSHPRYCTTILERQQCTISMNNSIRRNNFDVISTIRYDDILLFSEENTRIDLRVNSDHARNPTRFYMLAYHQERMIASARAFGWKTSQIEGPAAYDELLHLLWSHLDQKFDGRISLGPLMV